MRELMAMLEAITGESHERDSKAEYDKFKQRHTQRIAAMKGKK